MDTTAWAQVFLFTIIFIAITPLLGKYMAAVFVGDSTFIHPYLGWLEKLIYYFTGVDYQSEMRWTKYAKTWGLFNFLSFSFLFFLLIFQSYFPLNPQNFPDLPWSLALNTAISFATNTNWQAYSGEATMSYFTQMMGMTVQNFLSAASGITPFLVLTRGIARAEAEGVGNFWADLVRSIVYIFLPLSILMSMFLIGQGVIQTLDPYVKVKTLENEIQTIPLGPVASQVAIKQLGTNGGGFFNANSAHPFENPTPLSNLVEMLAMIAIPASLVYTYGRMVGQNKHSWMLFFIMVLLWGTGLLGTFYFEHQFNPALEAYPILEGKETRFGMTNSLLWSAITTSTANGSTNAMISSLSPLTGGIAMFNMMAGEIIFGGIGVGMCSMLMFMLLTVFLSGLMVGRTPEYLGKRIEKHEIQWILLGVLNKGTVILIGAGISCCLPMALISMGNQGPHGLSEILYAFSSSTGNNGSAFAGLNANTIYFNLVLGLSMLIGRLGIVIPSFAIGGLLSRKKINAFSLGTFSTASPLFFILLLSDILLIGVLIFIIPLVLGPILEQFLMLKGYVF